MKMELIAALLHSPEVLFLDEPTIGLDVVAQHNIQKFLKHYQEVRRITILLTSHYMKDVAALCRRVVVIAHGQIVYDGSLAGIIDRFSGHKVLTLLFDDGQLPGDLSRYGEVIEVVEPRVKLRVDRQRNLAGARRRPGQAHARRRQRRRPAAGRSDSRSVRANRGKSINAHPDPRPLIPVPFFHVRPRSNLVDHPANLHGRAARVSRAISGWAR